MYRFGAIAAITPAIALIFPAMTPLFHHPLAALAPKARSPAMPKSLSDN